MKNSLIDKLINQAISPTSSTNTTQQNKKNIVLPMFLGKFTDFSLKYANPDLLSTEFVQAAKSLERQLVDNIATPAWFAIDF